MDIEIFGGMRSNVAWIKDEVQQLYLLLNTIVGEWYPDDKIGSIPMPNKQKRVPPEVVLFHIRRTVSLYFRILELGIVYKEEVRAWDVTVRVASNTAQEDIAIVAELNPLHVNGIAFRRLIGPA